MGGMHGFGPIEIETDEPVFHAPWEGRVFGMNFTLGRWGQGRNWGSFRYAIERIPPRDLLTIPYYQRWYTVFEQRMLDSGLVTRQELIAGHADPERPRPEELPPPAIPPMGPGKQMLDITPRFSVGQAVLARDLNPVGHIRLPRYVRGRPGTVVSDNGVYGLQDTDATGQPLGDFPQHVYTVRFAAQVIWGGQANPRDGIYLDLWEDYLELP